MFEQTKSEKKEWKKTTARRSEIARIGVDISMKDIERHELEKEKYKEKGTGIYVGRGANDRLSAKAYNYVSIDPYGASDGIKPRTGNEQSYYYGYYERGTEKLSLLIDHPEISRLASIEDVAYNDALNGIELDSLPENIKSSKEYLEGYKKGLEEKLNKKSR